MYVIDKDGKDSLHGRVSTNNPKATRRTNKITYVEKKR